MKKPVVVAKNTTQRDLILGLLAGLAVLGILLLVINHLSSGITDYRLVGKITAKHFTPQPEEQVTIGSGGLVGRKLDGEYTLEVYVEPEQKTYTVWVDKSLYEAGKIGDDFHFMRPPSSPKP